MKVKAKRLGFYGNKRRNVGVLFNLKSSEEFSKSWMEEVKEDKKPAQKSSKAKPAKKETMEDSSEDVI